MSRWRVGGRGIGGAVPERGRTGSLSTLRTGGNLPWCHGNTGEGRGRTLFSRRNNALPTGRGTKDAQSNQVSIFGRT